jgi:hypothetical protein
MRPPLHFTRPSIIPEIEYAPNDFPDMLFDNKMFAEAANSVFIVFVFYQKSEVQAVVDGVRLHYNPHLRTGTL